MSKIVRFFQAGLGILVLAVLGINALSPTSAHAQVSCNTFLAIAISPAGVMSPGDTRTVTLTLGADGIQSGTKVTISNVRYELDCNNNDPLDIPCTDQGNIFNYQGDATITTTCGTCMAGDLNAGASCAPTGPGGGCDLAVGGDNAGTCVPVTWTSNVPAGGNATNEIVFSPSPPIDIPLNTFPYCDLNFDIKLDHQEQTMGPDSDSTPTDVEVVAGFTGSDAVCDNTLPSEGSQSASIPTTLGSVCGNGIIEGNETCDDGMSNSDACDGTELCRTDCTFCAVPAICPNRVIFLKPAKNDKYFEHVRWEATPTLNPPSVPFGVRLYDMNGNVIYSADLPAGAVAQKSARPGFAKYQFRDRSVANNPSGGISWVRIVLAHGFYRVKTLSYGNLAAAMSPENPMTVGIVVGSFEYRRTGTWVNYGRTGNKRKLP